MNCAKVSLAIDGGPQRRLVGRAFRIHPELLRYAVARRGGHQAIDSELAADNRNKTAHAVPCLVIEQGKAAADLAASRDHRRLRYVQRSNAAEDAQDARVHESRNQFIA